MRLNLLIIVVVFSMLPDRSMGDSAGSGTWQLVGSSRLSVLWFDIYDAEFSTPSGQFEGFRGPLKLKLSYLRDIEKSELLEHTEKNIAPYSNAEERMIWLQELQRIWPDIRKGDQLSFTLDSNGDSHFELNGRPLDSISESAFGPAFIQIWLAEDSEYPRVAARLRGEK